MNDTAKTPEFTTAILMDWLHQIAVASDIAAAKPSTRNPAKLKRRAMLARRAIVRLSEPWSGFAKWVPPDTRADGYRCLGWVHGDLLTIEWQTAPVGWWRETRECVEVQPTGFLPMPALPT